VVAYGYWGCLAIFVAIFIAIFALILPFLDVWKLKLENLKSVKKFYIREKVPEKAE
jgi:uncharacterized membrane protein